jgi:predicted transcriptional regulator
MRITLTLDEDVAARLKRLLRKRDANLKAVVNDALRRGLDQMEAPPKANKPFRMKTYDMGEALFPIDNITEALVFAEGDDIK